ncbi:hypothetical protein B9G69_011335 [Bdellovibrio sp. SKB1291214]|uniref:hypothetical protein n=1 Tax=Bdellovibrio sp. SKB1291214 TaxID=1732569 RepID=UPI000B5173E9|nr:hypothetical protein [Bdellovibrio sp. SKB1291214]UYL07639.1 hypothetical protein B9G69_011335 [Bdellovibrio sp. SKB1291214]
MKRFSMFASLIVSLFSLSALAGKPTLICLFTNPTIRMVVLAKGEKIGQVGDMVTYEHYTTPGEMGYVTESYVKDGALSMKISGATEDDIVLEVAFGKPGRDENTNRIYENAGLLKTAYDEVIVYGGCDLIE